MEIINEANFQEKVIKSTQPALIDFWAPSCGPCHRLTPIMEKLSMEFEGKVLIGKINVDENQELTSAYRVNAIPMLFFIKEGKVVKQMLGLQSENVLREELNKLL